MNDQTLDRNEIHDDHKKSNFNSSLVSKSGVDEMDSMIIEHKKMLYPQNIPLSDVRALFCFKY